MSKKDSHHKHTDTDEVVYESETTDNDHAVDVVAEYKKKLDHIKADLEKSQKEKQEYLDGWQRSKADFVNFKKRTDEEKKQITKYATEEFILEILPALDSFEMAFKDKQNWEQVPLVWRQGVESIYTNLRNVLKRHGVTELCPLHDVFDPALHHSIDVVPVNDEKDNGKVVDVVQKGYALGDKIIRHPNVRVGEKRV